MRISDWSSDVCSSDLAAALAVSTAAKAKVAIVFGCERTGLTNEELDLCHAVTMIPANPGYSSLNLSQAVQVLAYELRKASLPEVPTVSSKDGHPWYEPPPAEEMEQFYTHLQKRSEGHTSEHQPLMRSSSAVFCWNKNT